MFIVSTHKGLMYCVCELALHIKSAGSCCTLSARIFISDRLSGVCFAEQVESLYHNYVVMQMVALHFTMLLMQGRA